ncbi:MAG: sugar transferase [Bacteroidota bacterium]
MLTPKQLRIKRSVDLLLTLLVLPLVIVPMLLLLLIAWLSTGSSGWFVQKRIGANGDSFGLFKIRTLKGSDHKDIVAIKNSETAFGRWLRRTKLDELPQIFNVLKGDMSWVGPRPDVPGYADALEGEDRMILSVKPGITGPATLKYRNEDALLLEQDDPLDYNDTVIWPDKVKINKEYIENWSAAGDLKYLLASVFGHNEHPEGK